MHMHGKASSQKTREDQLSAQILELEQEIASRKKAEERIAALTEELKACKSQLALSDENIEERIRLDALLLEISAHFINLPSDQIDKAIEDAQRRVCECLEIDMCTLWQSAAENPDEMVLTHMYRSFDGPAVPSRMAASQNFPWSFQQALAGKTYVVPSIENVPAEAASQVPTWRYYGIKAVVGIPLITGSGRPFGVITFQDMRAARAWSEMLINRLQLVAQVFTSALIRKQIDSALRESEARLSMITEAVGAGLWVMEVDTKKIWVSPKSRELFHFSPDEEICYESYFRVIHPDDHERVNEYVRQTLQFGENRLCDYRIILPDGAIRWITSRAQRNCKSAGEPERLVGLSVDITDRKQMENQLREQLQKIEDFKQRLENENLYLQKEIQFLGEHMQIVGQSLAIKQILSDAHMVAQTDSTVLILGETGTGKELLARAIHQLSTRKGRAMVTINCAALPPTLIESELFGREKGAFTGALMRQAGRFELAETQRSSWMKSVNSRLRFRRNCCVCCSPASSNDWAAPGLSKSMCG